MEFQGDHRLPASRDVVWQALGDLGLLQAAIPGCERLRRDGDDLDASVRAEIDGHTVPLRARIAVADVHPPDRYRLRVEGTGGSAGALDGSADITLADDGPDATRLSYRVRAEAGGTMLAAGAAAVETRLRRDIDTVLSRLAEAVKDRTVVAVATAAPTGGSARKERPRRPATPLPANARAATLTPEEELADVEPPEEILEERLEVAAGRGFWGGPFMWGIIAFAVVVIILLILR